MAKVSADDRRQPLAIRLSPAERLLAASAARVNHQLISEFVREAIVTAAGECLEAVPASRTTR